MKTRALALRRALDAHGPGRGKRYEGALKSEVVTYAFAQHAEGQSWATIATELGVRVGTVRGWCGDEEPRAMRPVEIVAEPKARSLTVVSASGARVEGLTLDEAAALLRALQ